MNKSVKCFLTYRRFETKLPFVNSLTLGKLSEEKALTLPHAFSQHGATILEKWEDHYPQSLYQVWTWDAHRSRKQGFKGWMHFLSTTRVFHQKEIVSHDINGENMVSIRRSKQVKGESHENKWKWEESLYISLTETRQIKVANGNVTFCPHFKYLGSWVSFSLKDDHDVAKRIASANVSMGAMSDFLGWQSCRCIL